MRVKLKPCPFCGKKAVIINKNTRVPGKAELMALNMLLAQTPEADVIDRMSLLARKESVEAEIANLHSEGEGYYDIGCEDQGCYLFGGADYYRDLDVVAELWNTRKKRRS